MPPTKDAKVEVQVDALTETIRQLHEVSSRIDERIKHLIEKQNDMADKIERLNGNVADTTVRLAIIERAGLDKAKDDIEETRTKVAILERQFNNGVKSDVEDLKSKVRTLEFSNEHNTSFRTRGEARVEWWLN